MTLLDALPPLPVPAGPVRAEPLAPDRPVRFGILGSGAIAKVFTANLAALAGPTPADAPAAVASAVAARRVESAADLASAYDVPVALGGPTGYADLVSHPDVDVVYVATPHAMHYDHVRLALDAGTPVLCEKAFTLTGDQAAELAGLARERGTFLMEAMWTRCIPLVRRIGQLLDSGALGRVRQVRADLGFRADREPTDRLLDPALGGGALLDMGVYPLTFAQLFLGEPERVAAAASLSERGVDLDVAVSQSYASGAVASLTASMTAWSPRTASIATDRGRVDFADGFHHPRTATWTPAGGDSDDADGEPETWHEPVIGTGLAHEALEVARCLRAGETESPLVPLAETVALMRQMDAVRAQIGVRYAADG